MSRGRGELKRIPYLPRDRNRALEPLLEPRAQRGRNGNFDKLLFSNDAIFTVRPPRIR